MKYIIVFFVLFFNSFLFGQTDDIKWFPAPGLDDKIKIINDTSRSSSLVREDIKSFSYRMIEQTISKRLLILRASYLIEDKEGNRYIDRNNKDIDFYSLGVNVDNGYIIGSNFSLNPWLIDTSYEKEKGFKPLLKSIRYKHINQKEKEKFTDLSYVAVDENYLISKIDQESGLSINEFSETNDSKGEDLLLVSVGLNKNKIQVYYDSYNEVSKNLGLNPNVFFDQYFGSAIFKLFNDSDQIRISLVGVMGYRKGNYEVQKISSSEIKKMEKAVKIFKKKKNNKDQKKKK